MTGFLSAWPIATAATLLLAAIQGAGEDRRRNVEGWLVEDLAEQDGGRLVRMRRQAGSAHIRFSVAFWRGNDGRIQSTLVERSDCTDGEELSRHAVPEPAALRALLAHHLAACAVAPGRITAALAGFDAAYALLRAWADEAEAATRAEAAAVAAYGAESEADNAAGPR